MWSATMVVGGAVKDTERPGCVRILTSPRFSMSLPPGCCGGFQRAHCVLLVFFLAVGDV